MTSYNQPTSVSSQVPVTNTSIHAAFVRAAEMMEISHLADLYLIYKEDNQEKFEAVSVTDSDNINRVFCYRREKNIIFASLTFLFNNTPAVLFGKATEDGQLFELFHQSSAEGADEFLQAITVN